MNDEPHLFRIESKACDEELVSVGDVQALERDVSGTNRMLGTKHLHVSLIEATYHLGLGSKSRGCCLPIKCLGIGDDA